jgi:hypothetical protein
MSKISDSEFEEALKLRINYTVPSAGTCSNCVHCGTARPVGPNGPQVSGAPFCIRFADLATFTVSGTGTCNYYAPYKKES